MRLPLLFVALSLQCPPSSSLNFLIYNPMFGRSHVNFMSRLGDILYEAGHNVILLEPQIDPDTKPQGSRKPAIITVPRSKFVNEFVDEHFEKILNSVWTVKGFMEFMEDFKKMLFVMAQQCSATLDDKAMWTQLKGQTFDLAISEAFDNCGWAIFHKLNIEKTAMAISASSVEGFGIVTGLPSFPSYVPGSISSLTEKMSFLERLENSMGVMATPWFFSTMVAPITHVLEEKYGPSFPPIMDIFKNASLFFVNSEPLIDFPRPTIHKLIDVGGVTVAGGPKPLNKTWSDMFDLRKKTVLLSFGTVARSYLMPENYKKTIRETFRKFPDVTFIWKYEEPSHRISEGIDNIVEATFVPQNDMLYDPRLTLFITHCGAGSTMEATRAGVPLIVIPVMGDQQRNAMVINRIGSGIVLKKEMLDGTDELEKALSAVLNDPGYGERARKTGQMLRDKPFDAREVFLKNAEFAARYGPLRQLDHYGAKLNFFQYYLVDVFAFLGGLVLLVLVIVGFLLRCILRCAIRPFRKQKTE